MEPSEFIQLVRNFTTLNKEETDRIRELTLHYPFAQINHAILARASRDHQLTDQQQLLNLAATYSSDRAVLKQLLTAPAKPSETIRTNLVKKEPAELIQSAETPSDKISSDPVPTNNSNSSSLSGDDLRTDLMMELGKLQQLKHAFESAVEEFEHYADQSEPSVTESIIEEIETSHNPLPVENPSQKEQLEIIDDFIKTNPIIHKPRPEAPAKDLAEESASLSDNVVSETLVQILLKQGRKDKAIEVLKKLIWKFPQKKAYFAAQIEELKR